MSLGVKVVNNSYTPPHTHSYFLHFLNPNIKYEVDLDIDQFKKGRGGGEETSIHFFNIIIILSFAYLFLSFLSLSS